MLKKIKKITKEELVGKIGAENLALVEDSVYCAKCGHTVIVGYEDDIVIESSEDTILRGSCKKCGRKVARLIETGIAE